MKEIEFYTDSLRLYILIVSELKFYVLALCLLVLAISIIFKRYKP
jgi:hypothetical protein